MGEQLVQGPYLATRAGFEPTILRSTGSDSSNAPPSPTDLPYILPYHIFYLLMFPIETPKNVRKPIYKYYNNSNVACSSLTDVTIRSEPSSLTNTLVTGIDDAALSLFTGI